MGSLYSGTSVSGYNSNPPPDDGSTGANNQITWAGIKSKMGDPLNTFASSVNTNITNAFNKTISGATVVKTAVSYPMTAADQGRCIVATASGITITTPDATVVLNPFLFFFSNQSTGTITIAGNGSQNIDGNNTTTIYPGCGGIVQTDGANWFTNGLVQGNIRTTNPAFGFDMPINLQLNATVASNLLTIAVKANNGSDPSSSNPVLIPFRDVTGTSGDPVWVSVTAALSINTNAVGATLGTANNVPFRLWILAFNNGGTVVLALWQGVTGGGSPTALAALNESTFQSTTAISAAATSAGVFYTPNGTTLAAKAFRIIGYVDYQSGLATAGTYASGPNVVQLFGPGIKKPGDSMQTQFFSTSSGFSTTSNAYASSTVTQSITPTSPCNLVFVDARGSLQNSSPNAIQASAEIFRGSTGIGTVNTQYLTGQTLTAMQAGISLFAYDAPGTSVSTTYVVKIKNNDNATSVSFPGANSTGTIFLTEIQT